MANPEHVEVVKQGAKAIHRWRKQNPDVKLDLVEADLRNVDLSTAELDGEVPDVAQGGAESGEGDGGFDE